MATERERKFLVTGEAWRAQVVSERAIRQAYLASTPHAAIRIRISDDSKAVLTIKSAEPGIERSEFEYAVPLVDAEAMIALRTGEVNDLWILETEVGEAYRVTLESNAFDPYLLVLGPGGLSRDNDDAGDGTTNSAVRLERAFPSARRRTGVRMDFHPRHRE